MTTQEVKEKVENKIYNISNGLMGCAINLVKEEKNVEKILDMIYGANNNLDEEKVLENILIKIYLSYGKKIFDLN